MKKALALITSAAVAAVAVGIALGAIPGSGGVISGCYHKQLGVLRVYDAAGGTPKGCTSWERSITWNQTGPQGAAGPAGPSGVAGPQGLQGDPGENGVSGYEIVDSDDAAVLSSGDVTAVVTVPCPDGKVALGGGVESTRAGIGGGTYPAAVIASTPTAGGTGWQTIVARIDFDDAAAVSVTGYAVCAQAS